MKIAASLLFDSTYLECALITAFEASRRTDVFEVLHLIYLDRGGDDDGPAKQLVARFVAACAGAVPIKPIVIANTLPAFQAYHFNNSILYKPLIPAVLPGERFVLNLDAGILLGAGFDAYVTQVAQELCRPEATWVFAANNDDAAKNLTPEQLTQPHDPNYPDAAVLLFNVARFHATNWQARYLEALARLHGGLRYAEQELMCLASQPGEITDLPIKNQLKIHFLSERVLVGAQAPLPPTVADEDIYFKFKSSFKPWKYWVLDPDKAIYTRRRQRMEQVFPVAGHPLMEAERTSCLRPEWSHEYLRAYDRWLQLPVAAAHS